MRTRTILSALALAGTAALAGCSGSTAKPPAVAAAADQPSSTATAAAAATSEAEPRTYEGAKAAVARLDAIEKRHDGGAAWDMLTASGQAAMSRDDYIKVTSACSALFTSEPTVSVALNDSGTVATVTAVDSKGGGTFTWQMIYENGHWKHQPSDGAMTWMVVGADKALTMLRSGGYCG